MTNEYYVGQASIINALDDYIEEVQSHGDGIDVDTLFEKILGLSRKARYMRKLKS